MDYLFKECRQKEVFFNSTTYRNELVALRHVIRISKITKTDGYFKDIKKEGILFIMVNGDRITWLYDPDHTKARDRDFDDILISKGA